MLHMGPYREPSFSPRRNCSDTTTIKYPFSCSGTGIIDTSIRTFTQNSHANVTKSSAEHRAMPFNVKSPTTIFILQLEIEKTHSRICLLASFAYTNCSMNCQNKIFYLMAIDIAENFFPMLSWENRVKMPSNIYTHNLQNFSISSFKFRTFSMEFRN